MLCLRFVYVFQSKYTSRKCQSIRCIFIHETACLGLCLLFSHPTSTRFFGFSLAVTEALGDDFGRERPSKSEFSFSTNLMSRSARRPSSDAFLDLKNQSKLNCQALRISTRMRSQFPYPYVCIMFSRKASSSSVQTLPLEAP